MSDDKPEFSAPADSAPGCRERSRGGIVRQHLHLNTPGKGRRSFNATRDYTTSTFTVNDAYSVLFQATNLRTGRSTGIS
ncbi:hypothetical protein [Nonomuraea basaltis]|uniref:hypothetical protein n=1 Tax=Nonomuraea basaltis TaxID=2495887 RepID=UPI00110C66EC|nr:hypothetical protein [Nonomuraea basaltis]TMR95726.1 hypothetical protein EJK15_27395 [Nonomuraea basaltis]